MITVIFSHGKESGPHSQKINYLRALVDSKPGFSSISIDYRDLSNPDERIHLLIQEAKKYKNVILVGSSMGAYVSLCASVIINPLGLFLLSPTISLPGYAQKSPIPYYQKGQIIFGYHDEIIPVENIFKFAKKHSMPLTMIPGDHRLDREIELISKLFDLFLTDIHLLI